MLKNNGETPHERVNWGRRGRVLGARSWKNDEPEFFKMRVFLKRLYSGKIKLNVVKPLQEDNETLITFNLEWWSPQTKMK